MTYPDGCVSVMPRKTGINHLIALDIYPSPVAQQVERVAVKRSFHEKSWLKNRVNSGKPALRIKRSMVILSQALKHHYSGKVQRLELRLVLRGIPGEAPDTLIPCVRDG